MAKEKEEREKGFEWQVGVWDSMSGLYEEEIDRRFIPITDAVIGAAAPGRGERILDLGTGTGSLALLAAQKVGDEGIIIANDISAEMLSCARGRAESAGLANIEFREGGAEMIPAEDDFFDVVLASLSLMYVIDRRKAAKEIARVLRPGGRLAAAVWAAPEECDIVLFQATAGSFAPEPPVTGVGPGSMADTTEFIDQLASAGVEAEAKKQEFGFDFDDFESAWNALAGVTTAQLDEDVRERAKQAVKDAMWQEVDKPKHFRNLTQLIIGRRS